MRKSLYILPAILLFGVTTAGAQIGKDTESEQRNRPETQKPQDASSQPAVQQSQSGAPSASPMGSDTENEQRNRPETQVGKEGSSSQPGVQQSQSGARSPSPMGSDTEKEQRNRPETQVGKEGSSGQSKSSSAKDGAAITTASAVASAKDDQKVQLRGKIVSKRGGNEYMFQDSSGQVLVEIGARAFKGDNKQLKAGTEVEIQGEVDTRRGKPSKVEAKSVTVVASASGASGSSSSSR